MIEQAEAWKVVEAHASGSGRSGDGARSGARPNKQQSATGPTCHACGEVGHRKWKCPQSRKLGSVQNTNGGSPQGVKQTGHDRGEGRGRANHGSVNGRGGDSTSTSTADGKSSAEASSTGSSGGNAGSSGSSVAGRAVYVGGVENSVGSAGVVGSQTPGQAGPASGIPSTAASKD